MSKKQPETPVVTPADDAPWENGVDETEQVIVTTAESAEPVTDGAEDAEDDDWLAGASIPGVDPAEMKVDDGSFLADGQKRLLSLDLTDVDDKPPIIPPGIYHAKVVSASVETSKNSSKEMIVWEFVIIAGPHRNLKRRLWTTIESKDALWKVAQTLKALGVPGAGKALSLDLDTLAGRPCRLDIKADTYNGEPVDKINKALPADEETMKHMATAKMMG